ncbi:hypothetical protein BGX23_006842 [Mortierella sp. AD031]|nr:hypothetical protein BGX23_006842 [Mortierella sp. AD031]
MSGSEGQDPLRLTLEAIVRKSSFVTIGTVGQWISALKHLEPAQNSTGDRSTTTTTPTSAPAANSSFMFVMASLPLLEHGLRLLYVRLNRCKEDRKSALIAGEYYLTLDVILDQFVPPEYFEADAPALKEYRLDAIPNLLHAKLGPKAMNLLHDLFLAALGPRLRDRTSHGELNVYFTKDIRTEPWFDYYLGVVVYLLTLDPDSIPDGYEDVAEGICDWVEQYSQRRFDEWSALRKEAVQALCMLSEYPATISPIAGGPGAAVEHDEMDEVVAIGGATAPVESWITLRLKPKSSTVFASSNTFDTSTLPNLQDRIQLCLSAWLTSPFSQTVTNVGTGNNNKAQGMASNLPAWLLIVQSVQGATEKVATKMATFLQLQSQRQLSSRSRKQLEAMKPLVPGWLGMLAGCLALVEHFVLAGGSTSFQTGNGSNVAEIAGVQSLSLSDNTGTPSPPTTSEGNKTPNKGRNIESPRNRSETPPRTMENSGAVDKSSAAEIRLRLAMVNFLNKFVSNFERVKLPMIEAAWFDLLKSVEPLLSE